jgi:peptide deformylase
MAVKQILLLGNPVLRLRSSAVKDAADPEIRGTVEDLEDTLNDFRSRFGFGRGIAAPQIGVSRRLILIDIEGLVAMLNPRITGRSREVMVLWDDCFSFPDLLVKVKRNARVTVEYLDTAGKPCTLHAEGGLAELLQHEIDHLDGVLAIDRAIDSRHIVLRSEWAKMKMPPRIPVRL